MPDQAGVSAIRDSQAVNASGAVPNCLWHEVRARSRAIELVSLTVVPHRGIDTESAIAAVYDAIGGWLSAGGIAPLQEKVFALPDIAPSLDRIRRDRLRAGRADPDVPYTYAGYRPCVEGHLAGVQLLGVRGPVRCRTVRGHGCAGRLAEGAEQRALFVSQVRGGGSPAAGIPAALDAMYDRAVAFMASYGFDFRTVARTWIYLDDLLGWYDQLNQTRNRWFAREGVGSAQGPHTYPASTGIHAADPTGAPCFMDVVATTSGEDARPLHRALVSPRQGPATAYGSAFSRAVRVPLWATPVVYLSGTASIDAAGATCHVGDPRAQIDSTCETADAVLRSANSALADAATGVVYFKDAPTFTAWRDGQSVSGPGPLAQMIPVYAEICRRDLLFEIEASSFVHRSARVTAADRDRGDDGRVTPDVLTTCGS